MGKKSYDLSPPETEISNGQAKQGGAFRENAEHPPYQTLNFTTDAYEKQPNGSSNGLSDDGPQTTSKSGAEDRRTSSGKNSATGEVYMEDAGEGKEKRSGCCGGKKEKVPTVGVLELFRYAGPLETAMMVIGSLAAMATGCAQPMNMVILGGIVDTFIDTTEVINGTDSRGMAYEKLQPYIIYIVINGGCTLVAGYLAMSLWSWSGEKQIACIRKKFFRGVLRQDVGWFDTHKTGELNSRFSDDMHKIHEGMGDKMAVFIQWCCTWIVSYIVAFVHGWKLSLIVFAFSPVFVFVAAFMSKGLRSMAVKELAAYAKAGAIAEQALRAIRTVQVFQGQEKEEKKYVSNLGLAKKVGTRKGIVLGLGTGMFWAVIFGIFAVAFYCGVMLIQDENLEPGNILVVTFGVMIGSMSLGNAFPNLEAFTNARAAAVKVYEIINLCPAIDISSPSGEKPSSLTGVIEFKDVRFRYPARPDIQILNGLSFNVQPGQTVALVGASGCGKSTTVQLMQRFYDPEDGQVILDGHNLKDLNLKWLRDQIGVVNQEPVLFATTIAENIRFSMPEATMEAVQAAAKEANAHDFIAMLPQGYDTVVGERGSHLSGGQKQRIAIARALVKNPRILLLDEATSALDHESEAVVQSALEKAEEGRTTIVIAHRLSTVRNADKIVVIHHGLKQEEGSHTELMEKHGVYAKLVKLQIRHEEEGDDDIEIAEDELDDDNDNEKDGAADDVLPIPRVVFRSMSSESKKSAGKEKEGINGELGADRRASSTESTDSTKEEKHEAEAKFVDLVKLNAPEWPYVTTGTIMCTILGLVQPSFAFVFAEFLRVFSLTDEDEQINQARLLAGVIGGIAVLVCVLRVGSNFTFAKAGSELTARLRKLAFCSMLRQDMSYFDHPENQVGALSTRLSSDAAMVQGATGSKIGQGLEALSTIIGVLIISFLYGWKLTLVILAFMPVLIVAGKVQGAIIADSAKSSKKQVHEAGKICSEAIDNIRTVVSLNSEDVCIHKLETLLDTNARRSVKWAQSFGAVYGLSLSIQYFAMAAAYAYGSRLVSDGEMEFQDVFRVFSAIVMGGSSIGRNTSFGLDYTKAKVAAGRLFAIINKEPKIDVDQKEGLQLTNYTGRVQLDKVEFHYPTRDTVRVLAGLSLRVEPGMTLALVGSSGCGKSTVLQLLQRFYDPDSGALLIDSHDLKDLNLRWFRQQLGIVSQEPTLFDDTIAANIAYGDNSREVPMGEIMEAARMANIHNFIADLPMGYETQVGDKGTQLSGGQKQRIAIARALVRQPKILLLDEATSALDTASERVVQDALDKAREGRTCIIIAHRLSTVQNADRIVVLGEGVVQEAGTHAQLLAQKGAYHRLLQAHQLQ